MVPPIMLRVRQVREALGISQRELARRSGVTISTVSRIETGKVALVDLTVLDKLARALDVDPALLVIRTNAGLTGGKTTSRAPLDAAGEENADEE